MQPGCLQSLGGQAVQQAMQCVLLVERHMWHALTSCVTQGPLMLLPVACVCIGSETKGYNSMVFVCSVAHPGLRMPFLVCHTTL
jgi:hypothetical protein